MPELQKKKFQEYTNVSRETMSLFQSYYDILINYQTKVNLIGSGTLRNIWLRHFLDSARLRSPILCLIQKNKSVPIKILDVGTGAGFPGVVLSILFNKEKNLRFFLADSNIKKIKFLEALKSRLNLNVEIIYSRAEVIEKKFDLIIARAVANLDKLFKITYPLCKKNSVLIFLKGKNWKSEIKSLKKYWKFKNFIVKTKDCSVYSDGVILLIKELRKIHN